MLKIGLDAMGGDFAPEAAVKGAVMASAEIGADSKIVLFGDKERIEAILAGENCPADRFEIVPTTEVIEMGDHPAKAFQQKADSSISVGFAHLAKGAIQGFASASKPAISSKAKRSAPRTWASKRYGICSKRKT